MGALYAASIVPKPTMKKHSDVKRMRPNGRRHERSDGANEKFPVDNAELSQVGFCRLGGYSDGTKVVVGCVDI